MTGPAPLPRDLDHLVQPGFRCRCDQRVPQVMAVAYVMGQSGPGCTVKACVPHARQMADHPLAPDWLKADLDALDTLRGLS
ncbi:hypothetical protein [Streptomyces axinellae]|uniref:Uncharacterized protein n=1 Tax=Streptomyces axinellae TaxID=552788 RepID=A0ABN3PSP5_9ACTN